ncbi:MAG: hypothetical protein AAFN77_12350, partial [Planctomycetota bacterium]
MLQFRACPARSFNLRAIMLTLLVMSSCFFNNHVASAQQSDSKAASFSKIEAVIADWSKDQHLFVNGDVGISEDQLGRLESWLDQNRSNWTIVLMKNAKNQVYVTVDGRSFTGMDAVEYALGHGLANRTRFGELVHAETAETNGAVFVLFLEERKFSYYGSDVHDRRRLGEAQWLGNLDRPAIRAMRNGGRIIDAVKDTVNHINQSVAASIRREKSLRKQAAQKRVRIAQERDRQLAEQRTLLQEDLPAQIKTIESAARQLRQTYPEAADSELAQPPVDQWNQRLASIRPNLTIDNLSSNRTKLNQIRDELEDRLDAFAAHDAFDTMRDDVLANLEPLQRDRTGTARRYIDDIRSLLDDAATGHTNGSLTFAGKIHQANELVRDANAEVQKETRRLNELAERRAAIRNLITWVLGAFLIVFLAFLWWLNRRRRPFLRKAHDLFDQRTAATTSLLAQLDELNIRVAAVLGSEDELEQRQYAGSTLALGKSVFSRLDDHKLDAEELTRVIDEANSMLHPGNPIAEAMNMFTSHRYVLCLEKLNGESYQLIRDTHAAKWTHFQTLAIKLTGDLEKTDSELDELKHAIEQVVPKLKEVAEKLRNTSIINDELGASSRRDGYFQIPTLEDSLIPTVKLIHQNGQHQCRKDPVGVVNDVIPGAVKRLSVASQIASSIKELRTTGFATIDQAADQLRSRGYQTRWIRQTVEELAALADQLMKDAAADELSGKQLSQFLNESANIPNKAQTCAALSESIDQKIEQKIIETEQRIASTGEEVAARLKIPVESALIESNYDPSVELQHAKRFFEAAKTSLNLGNAASCQQSLDESMIEITHANQLIDVTIELLNSFDIRMRETASGHESIQTTFAKRQPTVDMICREYRPESQELVESTPLNIGEASDSVVSHLAFCQRVLSAAPELIQQIQEHHGAGKVLESAAMNDNLNSEFTLANRLLQEIQQHAELLEETTRSNRNEIQEVGQQFESIFGFQNKFETRSSTINELQKYESSWSSFVDGFRKEAQKRAPLIDSASISEFNTAAIRLKAQIDSDHHAFQMANESLKELEQEWATSVQLLRTSSSDRIPDSTAIDNVEREAGQLDPKIQQLRQQTREPHQDWMEIDATLSRLISQVAIINATLRRELQLAKRCVDVLQSASDRVREASNWSPSYGVRMRNDYGQHRLRDARRALGNGDYQNCLSAASLALNTAK